MNAEILSVGTELLLGHTVNTDAAYVARELSNIGINLLFSCVVGDNPERLRQALETAFSRSDVVITTGGLGPTGDDLTKETIAKAAGRKLVLHEESKKRLQSYFQGRVCGSSQEKQAWLPEGCTVLNNDVGTAPGCAFETQEGATVIMLPGPPGELVPMLKNHAVPYLEKKSGAVIASRMIRVFGLGEGRAAEMLGELLDGANPTAATYCGDNEMFVRVTGRAATKDQALALCRPLEEKICRILGNFVYGVDTASLEETVVRGLAEQGKTLAAAESCTGGLLSKRVTDVDGASAVFPMGVVTYSNESKALLLDVPQASLDTYGAVSEQVARAMARGVRQKAGSTFGIGITGIAGPGGGTPEKPVGLVYIALSDGKQDWVRRMLPPGRPRERSYLRNMAVSNALDMVRRCLQKLPQEGNEQATALYNETR